MESGREQGRGKEDEGGKGEDTRQKKDCNKKDIHKYGKSSMKDNPHRSLFSCCVMIERPLFPCVLRLPHCSGCLNNADYDFLFFSVVSSKK